VLDQPLAAFVRLVQHLSGFPDGVGKLALRHAQPHALSAQPLSSQEKITAHPTCFLESCAGTAAQGGLSGAAWPARCP
jgi:hypothetical protein